MAKNIDADIQQILDQQAYTDANMDYGQVTPEDLHAAEIEAGLEQKYGSNELEALAGQAASVASLGISDQILRAAGVSAERLRETRERSPISTGVGTVVGAVAPLAAGDVAGVLPVAKAAKAGMAAETFAAAALKDKIRSEALKDIVAKTAGGASEGALLGLGNAVSEDALGRSDLNAENIVANAGAGALLGGGVGAAFGSAASALPIARKGLQPIKSKLSQYGADLTDPVKAAKELTGLNSKRVLTIEKYDPDFFQTLPQYFSEKLGLRKLSTADDLAVANSKLLDDAAKRIRSVSNELDAALKTTPNIAPSRPQVYGKLLDALEQERLALELTENVSKADIKTLLNFRDDILKLGNKKQVFSFDEFDALRKSFQGIKYKGGGASESFKAFIAEKLRGESRKIINEIADGVQTAGLPGLENVAQRLKEANKDFYTAATIKDSMLLRASKETLLKWGDIVEAAAFNQLGGVPGLIASGARKFIKTDLRRNLAVLADVRRQQIATEKLTKGALEKFFSKSKPAARILSTKALMGSGYSLDDKQQGPKNKQQAFENASKNITALLQDSEKLTERLAIATGRLQQAAPNISSEVHNTLVRGLQFLSNKLPRPMNSGSDMMFPKQYHPTSVELAKFERYLQAVESPVSVLEDLESGAISREHTEALKEVYPAFYAKLQSDVLDYVAENPDKLSYSRKVQLGILLDIPTDESLTPQAILGLQANFLPPESDQSNKSLTAKPQASNMGFASREASGTERVANRKG